MPDLPAFRRVFAEMVCAYAGATDPRLVQAFTAVPREHYLGPGPWKFVTDTERYAETPSDDPVYLYEDRLYAIDASRRLNNGLPGFLARLIDALALKPGDRVAHVGAGVGYYTAIMAEMVGPSGRVFGREVDASLAARAGSNLAHYGHVEVAAGSGIELDCRNLDALFINAGATHPLPAWLDTLAPGGRLVLPLTGEHRWGIVVKITRRNSGFDAACIGNVGIYPCEGARDPAAAKALARALKKGGQESLSTLRRDRHPRGESCWLHGRDWCFSTTAGEA
jgi:protein-L-isoaspartate(D-aspartate) O-methyltransferase